MFRRLDDVEFFVEAVPYSEAEIHRRRSSLYYVPPSGERVKNGTVVSGNYYGIKKLKEIVGGKKKKQ